MNFLATGKPFSVLDHELISRSAVEPVFFKGYISHLLELKFSWPFSHHLLHYRTENTMLLLSVLTGLAATSVADAKALHYRSSSPVVNTTYGLIQGTTSEYREGVSVFKGIPFASPPTGSLRWKAPAAASSWSSVLNATAFGADCAQSYSSAGIFSSGSEDISEDCLYLNIWAPSNATATSNLPVYFWIYGGRFEGGAGSVKTYDGSGLASKDIVVVNFNYRMGPFGFLAHPDLSAESGHNSSGNYGLLDQQAALQWVRSEISAFGGNPNHITTGGQSAGSASSLDMMYSPLVKDQIVGAIAESGARGPHDPETYTLATSYRQKAAAEAYGVTFLAEMNVSTIAELRNVSTEALLTYDSASDTVIVGTAFQNVSGFMEPPAWRPVLDGYVLTHGYGESLQLNAHTDVPILTGNNKDESGASPDPGFNVSTFNTEFAEMFGNLSTEFFALYPANNDTQADDSANAMFRDLSRVSTWTWASDWRSGGAKSNVYTYYFTHAPPNQTSGVYHGAELWYAFNNIPYGYFDDSDPWTTDDYTIEGVMSQYWANFIKTGNPNGGNLTYWPASSNVTQTMWLGDSLGAQAIADSDRIAFMQKFFAQQVEF